MKLKQFECSVCKKTIKIRRKQYLGVRSEGIFYCVKCWRSKNE